MKLLLPKSVRNKLIKFFATQKVTPSAPSPSIVQQVSPFKVDDDEMAPADASTSGHEAIPSMKYSSGERKRSRKHVTAEKRTRKRRRTHKADHHRIRSPKADDPYHNLKCTPEWKLLSDNDKKLIKTILQNQFWRAGRTAVLGPQEVTTNREVRCWGPRQTSSASRGTSGRRSISKNAERPPFRMVGNFKNLSEFSVQ